MMIPALCVANGVQVARFHVSDAVLFWDVTQRLVVVTDASGRPVVRVFKRQAVPLHALMWGSVSYLISNAAVP